MLDPSPVKVAACGRRWGKTEAQAVDAAACALLVPGSQQMIVAPTYDQSRLIASTVERLLLERSDTRRLTTVRRTPYTRITVGSSSISARSADDDGRGLRGHRADRVIVDEAAYVREEVVQEVIRPMLADTDGQLVLISTPLGRNYFWRMWMSGQQESSQVRSYRFPSSSNPHISAVYLASQKDSLPQRAWRSEYEAEFIDDASAVFTRADLEACRLLAAPDALPGQSRVLAGIDWARHGDYTALVALETGRHPWRVVAAERFQERSWQASIDRAAAFLRASGAGAALCDATGLGDPLVEMLQRHDDCSVTQVQGFVFTSTSKRDLIDNLAVRLSHCEVALPQDDSDAFRALLLELESFEYSIGASEHVSYSAPPGMHDDLVCALALGCWCARTAPDARVLSLQER